MNFFVISDIHGSSAALNDALEIYHSGDFDRILICGDILYHGARNPLPAGHNPKEVIDLLNALKEELIVVRGNCESEVDGMVLDFPINAEYSHVLTEELNIFLTHGHIYNSDNLPPLKDNSIFLFGHTHIPKAVKVDSIYLFNPGSISLPKGGFTPTYGVLTNDLWEVRDLSSRDLIMSCNI